MEFIPNPHKIEHPAGVHMLDNQSRITLWQTEPAALLYAQMLQGCLREYAGLEVPFSCTSGVCGTCRARLLEGEVRMERNFALDKAEVAAGFVLTCQSHPVTDRVRISYDGR